jgi:hypothetical protein
MPHGISTIIFLSLISEFLPVALQSEQGIGFIFPNPLQTEHCVLNSNGAL